ncbi:MAG: transposase [Akkermansia sp.]|nr:transposase [Akkermansia sp.]
MDLCSPFRNLVMRIFPNAKIVAGRFHAMWLGLETLPKFCRACLLSDVLMGAKRKKPQVFLRLFGGYEV